MFTPSRTPEGQPFHCPLCGRDVCLEPSVGSGDATCPHCGQLPWRATQRARPRASIGAVICRKVFSILIRLLACTAPFVVVVGVHTVFYGSESQFGFGYPEILALLVLGFLLFGRRLPEVGHWLGQGIEEFKRGLRPPRS